ISHYYWIRNEEDRKVATASIATPYGGTRLYSVMNRAGKNEGVFEVNLDLLFDRQRLNTSFYSRPGTVNLDIREHTDLFTRSFQQRTAEEMPATFLNLFDKLSG
ncbi:MAG: hypothetical protein R3211_12475, partial [Balneolaceae bacterium]|nr:hypothetical protein [Balneolaceae bacterium]